MRTQRLPYRVQGSLDPITELSGKSGQSLDDQKWIVDQRERERGNDRDRKEYALNRSHNERTGRCFVRG